MKTKAKVLGKRHWCMDNDWLPEATLDSVGIVVKCVCGYHYVCEKEWTGQYDSEKNGIYKAKWSLISLDGRHNQRVDSLTHDEYLGRLPFED